MSDSAERFTLVSNVAGATTQVVVAGGAVGLAQAKRVEAVIVEGLLARRTTVILDLTGEGSAPWVGAWCT
jgi:hypothetical protein